MQEAPIYEDAFEAKDLAAYRKALKLSVREFASCFGFSAAAITRIECGLSSGREILKRAVIYAHYPHVALDQIQKNGGVLHTKKRLHVESWLHKQLNSGVK